MADELDKMDEVRRRVGVSYEEARFALEEAGGDVAEAVVLAERDRATAGADLAATGMAFLDELKRLVSGGPIRAMRVKFGNRTLKEFIISSDAALVLLGVAVGAVLLTKLRVEVERGPEGVPELPRPGAD